MAQTDLFDAPALEPEGLRHRADLITEAEADDLVRILDGLAFAPFDFQGHLAHRQVASFGWRYDYADRRLREAPPIPDALLPLRRKCAAFAERPAEEFEQVLINLYEPGAGIGWHRDRPQFAEVIGLSLLAPCDLRFRRRTEHGWMRRTLRLEPRSAYLLSGPARWEWEHSIRPLPARRYSVTFRRRST